MPENVKVWLWFGPDDMIIPCESSSGHYCSNCDSKTLLCPGKIVLKKYPGGKCVLYDSSPDGFCGPLATPEIREMLRLIEIPRGIIDSYGVPYKVPTPSTPPR